MLEEKRDAICPRCGGPKFDVTLEPNNCDLCDGKGMVTSAQADAYRALRLQQKSQAAIRRMNKGLW